jgi:hypothetical protein
VRRAVVDMVLDVATLRGTGIDQVTAPLE